MQKYVLVTGASTGIGRAVALDLATRGFEVIAGVRKQSDGDSLERDAQSHLRAVTIDVTKADSIEQCADQVRQIVGDNGLYGLINNAGIVVSGPLEFVPLDDLRWQFEVNVVGQIAVTQAMMPLLRSAKGRVVFTSSSSGYFAAPFLGPYSASKFAVEALVDSMRRELIPWDVDVIAVEPGAIKTPIWEKSKGKAQAMIEALPAKAVELYATAIESVMSKVDDQVATAADPQVVADAVYDALNASKASTRYKVGTGARLQYFLSRWVPDRVVDKLVRKDMGL